MSPLARANLVPSLARIFALLASAFAFASDMLEYLPG
jgi:hypothetical protein